jgi:glucose-6-phosphate isomerase
MLKINIDKIYPFVSENEIQSFNNKVIECNDTLNNKSGKGSDFLGWIELPSSVSKDEISKIEYCAQSLASVSDIIVVIGIGGSYLGARAVIDALSSNFNSLLTKLERKGPLILYAGNNIGEDYQSELISLLDNKDYSVIVVSKSGTTTEPAITFRLLKDHLEKKYGKDNSKKRIAAVTDKSKGALKKLADSEGYETFVIPDDIGGRYSVLTPVGLLPISAAGFNINKLLSGAQEMEELTGSKKGLEGNPSNLYAAARNALYQKGKAIEILASFTPNLNYFIEWWKQLYGESEGKDNKGIFPAGVNFTTDLHSMGQWIQEGTRNIFETVINVEKSTHELRLPKDDANLDELNYISGKRLSEVNKMAELGTMLAHVEGGVPNISVSIETLDEENLGQLIYFFEKACGISGYFLGVNPFDQPGVEAYKKNMFALLGKPGFEKMTKEIREKL